MKAGDIVKLKQDVQARDLHFVKAGTKVKITAISEKIVGYEMHEITPEQREEARVALEKIGIKDIPSLHTRKELKDLYYLWVTEDGEHFGGSTLKELEENEKEM